MASNGDSGGWTRRGFLKAVGAGAAGILGAAALGHYYLGPAGSEPREMYDSKGPRCPRVGKPYAFMKFEREGYVWRFDERLEENPSDNRIVRLSRKPLRSCTPETITADWLEDRFRGVFDKEKERLVSTYAGMFRQATRFGTGILKVVDKRDECSEKPDRLKRCVDPSRVVLGFDLPEEIGTLLPGRYVLESYLQCEGGVEGFRANGPVKGKSIGPTIISMVGENSPLSEKLISGLVDWRG
jgi:hypothetical protein